MRSYLLIAPIALGLVACGKSDANAAQSSGGTTQTAAASATVSATGNGATAIAQASGAGGVAVAEAIGIYDFTYSYPAAAAAVPALKTYLDQDMARRRATLVDDAREADAAIRSSGRDSTNRWDRGFEWLLVAELPRWEQRTYAALIALYEAAWKQVAGALAERTEELRAETERNAPVRRVPLSDTIFERHGHISELIDGLKLNR